MAAVFSKFKEEICRKFREKYNFEIFLRKRSTFIVSKRIWRHVNLKENPAETFMHKVLFSTSCGNLAL
jgi:hypothetical protein